jgi:hypothetical protein
MPLIKGPRAATKKGIARNIKVESLSKPKKQSIAIALSLAGKSKRKKPS